MRKKCSKCLDYIDISLFYKSGRSKDGVQSCCKECKNKVNKETRQKNAERIKKYRSEYYQKNKKSIKNSVNSYQINRKKEKSEYQKKYYKNNLNKILSSQREYKKRNKHKQVEYNKKNRNRINESYKKRRSIDPLFKLIGNTRSLIRQGFIKQGFSKKTKTYEILGCSFEEFKLYLESKFDPWMNWNNYGPYKINKKRTWNIDHILPLSSANTEEEIVKLNHYTNLRPLCSKLNLDKGNFIATI